MGLSLVTAPTQEPLTASEAKRHLRLDTLTNGEPVPTVPTVALAGAGAGNVDNGSHRYRLTFVTADGETDGGEISDIVTVADKTVNGKVSVTNIPLGGSRVTQRKLYRTVAAGSTYLLLTTIADNTTTTYTDNTADASLGVGIPSTNTTEDPEVRSLITAARQVIEEEIGRALMTQTWDYTISSWPESDELIRLPRPPLVSVTSVKYYDSSGVEQTLATSEYLVDASSPYGRISLAPNKSWPAIQTRMNAVTIRFVAGYGSVAAIPEPIRNAMKLVLGDLYRHREAGITGTIHTTNPAVDALLSPYELLRVA